MDTTRGVSKRMRLFGECFVHVTKQHLGVIYKILDNDGFLAQKGCTNKKMTSILGETEGD